MYARILAYRCPFSPRGVRGGTDSQVHTVSRRTPLALPICVTVQPKSSRSRARSAGSGRGGTGPSYWIRASTAATGSLLPISTSLRIQI